MARKIHFYLRAAAAADDDADNDDGADDEPCEPKLPS